MKFVRYGAPGREKPGLLDAQGRIRCLLGHAREIDLHVYSREGQRRMREIDPESLPLVRSRHRLGVPFVGIGKFIGIGLNYRDHAEEAGLPIPSEPVVFNKWTSCISGPFDDIVQPPHSTKLDWEVELGVVIGRPARYVAESEALKYVAGYCVINDVSERHFQFERGTQWDKGKGCDTFGPIGPWLVSADEVPDPQALDLWLDLNSKRMQTGNTRSMIFSVRHIISYLSRFMSLLPGDVIATGTPPGVAMGMKTPRWMMPGDVLSLGIGGLGEQRQRVVAA